MNDGSRIPTPAAWLGYGGLLPVAAAALACWLGGDVATAAASALRGYSAAILAFLGGIPWGLAVRPGARMPAERLIAGVLPPLVAWLALLLPVAPAIIALLVAFAAWFVWDRMRNLGDVAAWFPRLRAHLTAGVVACHLLVLPTLG